MKRTGLTLLLLASITTANADAVPASIAKQLKPLDIKAVELTGDAIVKRQVIARYLNAEERASQIPPSSVALTPSGR